MFYIFILCAGHGYAGMKPILLTLSRTLIKFDENFV